jgi:hypothetical protein
MSWKTRSQRFKGHFYEDDVWSLIFAKHVVWCPISAIFSEQAVASWDLDACVPVPWEFWEWAVAGGVGEPKSRGRAEERRWRSEWNIWGVDSTGGQSKHVRLTDAWGQMAVRLKRPTCLWICDGFIGGGPVRVVFSRNNYLYDPLRTHAYFLCPKNFQLIYLASNPTFDSLSDLSVNLTL